MAKKPDIGDLLEKHGPLIENAFLEAIREITSKARIADIVRALEKGDIQGAIDALYIDRAAFRVFERALGDTFDAGGINTADNLPAIKEPSGGRFLIRFDARNIRAEQWLKDHSSDLVTRIIDEQRGAIREHLLDGMASGTGPRNVALDIVGRINNRTGRREGGVVGLSAPQEEAVRKARKELQEGRFNDFMQRAKRDKRFDRTLAKAGREERKLSAAEIDKIINRYSDSLLKLRGETIGRTEALASLHAAQDEAIRQLVDSGRVRADQIKRVWDSSGDLRTRLSHVAADGQTVGLNDKFTVGGRLMKYPGDPNGGAAEVINCRCRVNIKIDFLANLR